MYPFPYLNNLFFRFSFGAENIYGERCCKSRQGGTGRRISGRNQADNKQDTYNGREVVSGSDYGEKLVAFVYLYSLAVGEYVKQYAQHQEQQNYEEL